MKINNKIQTTKIIQMNKTINNNYYNIQTLAN
jgi:hypothetical protein